MDLVENERLLADVERLRANNHALGQRADRAETEARLLRAEVERLRSQVTDWQPIKYERICPGMRVRATRDGVETIMTVARKNDFGELVSVGGERVFDPWQGNVWEVDPRTLSNDPEDACVRLLAEELRKFGAPTVPTTPEITREFRDYAVKLLARLNALRDDEAR